MGAVGCSSRLGRSGRSPYTDDEQGLRDRAWRFLMPALPDFFATYPRIELTMSERDRWVDPVQEGVDCVLRYGELRDSDLAARLASDGQRRAPRGVVGFAARITGRHVAHGRPRIAVDLETGVYQIQDPILGNARRGVDLKLGQPVLVER